MLIWYLIEFLLSKVGKGILSIPEDIWLTSESSQRKIGKNETLWGFSFGQSKKAGQDVKGIVAEYSTWRTINKKESKGGTAPKTSSKSKTTTSNAATAMLTILEKTSRACAPKIANAFQVEIAFFHWPVSFSFVLLLWLLFACWDWNTSPIYGTQSKLLPL